MIVPPPTPNSPLKAPAAVPIAASFRVRSGATPAILRPCRSRPAKSCSRCSKTRRGRRSSPTSTGPSPRSSTTRPRPRSRRETREVLAALAQRFALVGCISGRQATEARRLVGLDGIAYAGNHGLELMLPGDDEPRPDPSLAGDEDAATRLPRVARRRRARRARPPSRGQGPDPGAALARRARRGGGRAPGAGDRSRGGARWARDPRGAARSWSCGRRAAPTRAAPSPRCLAGGIAAATYAGDDRTDLDAFAKLREMVAGGRCRAPLCVGVISPEAPPGIASAGRPDRRRPARLARPALRTRRLTRALHRTPPPHRPAHRRRGDRPRRDHRRRRPARRRHDDAAGLRGLVGGGPPHRALPRLAQTRRRQRPRGAGPRPHRDQPPARERHPDRGRPPLAHRRHRRRGGDRRASSSPASARSPRATRCSSR